MPAPDIEAALVNQLFFGAGTTAPATIDVRVRNRATVPITIRRVELDSPGMGQFVIQRISRIYRELVPPGEGKSVTVFATAIAQTSTRPTEPLTIRAIVELEGQGQTWREIVILRQGV